MGTEIERKFRVVNDAWRRGAIGETCRQAYLCSGSHCMLRVRLIGGRGLLTIKGRREGLSRPEYEYAIPPAEAVELIDRFGATSTIEKTRYQLLYENKAWVVDVFEGANAGLVLAEVELERADETVALPPWAGEEVSCENRFSNMSLSIRPFSQWPDTEENSSR